MTDAPIRRRWDPLVKLTHWSVAFALLANALFTEGGSSAHVWIGYALAGILALRLLWGLVGPEEARFRAFPPSPARAVAHVREIAAGKTTAHRSHNPLGALMVYAIWGTMLVIIGTGIGMAGLPSGYGADERPAIAAGMQAGEESGEAADGEREEGPLTEVHEAAANLLYALILLHIGGVVFESRRQRRNLALAMLPGGR
ncbi:cytochrome b/b6 domain-containing protein [Novosphingobium sp.]|uniref:cytochrome b/b6 domain-containing protein n=1 Tax=Novosphingobium sp. TaxID=1874826 RepID=UPI002621B1B7|nr:cytochrome b/b6 domain-containing protein [Novosphingobium sp.]